MPGKPRKLTDEQVERARKLVEEGYQVKDVEARFGVKTGTLYHYGIRAPESSKKGRHVRLPRA